MLKKNRTLKLVVAALLAALVCIVTMVIQIPMPHGGYLNLGDAIVITFGCIFGGWYGVVASAIGSALADVISSFVIYAPGTFVIKGAVALISWLIYKGAIRNERLRRVVATTLAEIFMIAGYYLYDALAIGLGFDMALANVPMNILQGVFSVIAANVIIEILIRNKHISGFFGELTKKGE